MRFQPLQLERRPEPFSHPDWLFEILCDRPHNGDVVRLKPDVRLPFKVPRQDGIVRFAYDHEPAAYEVEFFWCGRSLGKHYLTDDELQSTGFSEWG